MSDSHVNDIRYTALWRPLVKPGAKPPAAASFFCPVTATISTHAEFPPLDTKFRTHKPGTYGTVDTGFSKRAFSIGEPASSISGGFLLEQGTRGREREVKATDGLYVSTVAVKVLGVSCVGKHGGSCISAVSRIFQRRKIFFFLYRGDARFKSTKDEKHTFFRNLSLMPVSLYLTRRLPERDYFPIRILSFEDK
ncbi:hypothetical protein ANTPLA_LOCUS3507 [Anthophora plagiata]